MKSWFSEQKKSFFTIGPLLPLGLGSKKQSSATGGVDTFLDRMLLERGEKSVLFVSFLQSILFATLYEIWTSQMSFGTAFFPSAPEYLEEVLEALIEKKFPFVSLKELRINRLSLLN